MDSTPLLCTKARPMGVGQYSWPQSDRGNYIALFRGGATNSQICLGRVSLLVTLIKTGGRPQAGQGGG